MIGTGSKTEAEIFAVEFSDWSGRVLQSRSYSDGERHQVAPPLKDIVSTALSCAASAITVSHNHPSGLAKPSIDDHAFTKRLVDILHPLGIRVYDHIIVAGAQRYSFRAEGLL